MYLLVIERVDKATVCETHKKAESKYFYTKHKNMKILQVP